MENIFIFIFFVWIIKMSINGKQNKKGIYCVYLTNLASYPNFTGNG